jgi:hypothetical protein
MCVPQWLHVELLLTSTHGRIPTLHPNRAHFHDSVRGTAGAFTIHNLRRKFAGGRAKALPKMKKTTR